MDEQLSVRISEEDYKKLEQMARRKGVNISAIVRELVKAAELVPAQMTVYSVKATVQA